MREKVILICSKCLSRNYQTTKKDKSEHGLGLKNIEKAVKNYNGYMKIENNNQFFELSFVLYDV